MRSVIGLVFQVSTVVQEAVKTSESVLLLTTAAIEREKLLELSENTASDTVQETFTIEVMLW